jgi:PKD repeat protein
MFADTSSIGGDSLAAWQWDFGVNGGTASVQDPTFVYPFADTLTVQLVIASNEGCTDTITGPIIVRPLPMVDFGMSSVCWPDTVAFTDSTTIAGDLINGYTWHFGDGAMDAQQHTSHAYAASGDYDVVLWVSTASGCADSALQTLHVNDKPLAQFAATPVCYPAGTAFANQSTVQADSLVAWHWDFGDGGLDSLASPSHTYAVADTYAVSLAVVSAFGCRDTTWQDVIVLPKPVAAFNPPSACYPLPLTFVDGSGVNGDNIAGSDWDFGDGNTASGFLTLHQYANAGSYLVTLVTETSSGCKDTLQDSVYLYARPTAAFTVQSVCDGDTASFVDGSSVSSGSIAQHLYSFGDGNTSNATDPDWAYGGPGTYLTSLTVTSDHNCFATAVQSLVIHALPDPAPMVAGYQDICIGDTAHLQELQSFQHYAWETGDTTNAILVFGRTDWVVLTVVDSNQCIGSDSVAVRYHNVPRPNAVVTPGPDIQACANDSLVLTAGGSYSSYLWSDGQTTETHFVTQSGAISVLVFNGFGCADTSDIATITLLPAPAVPTITQVGPLLTASAAAAYQWYFNQLAIPGATGQSFTANATGDYAVRVTNAAGCSTFSTTRSLIVAAAQPLVHDLRIYPNPFADALHLQGQLQQGGTLHLRLLNVTGQEVLTQTQTVAAGQVQIDLDTAKLPAGYYLCELRIGARVIVRAVARQ